jgi:hypothetical protein
MRTRNMRRSSEGDQIGLSVDAGQS